MRLDGKRREESIQIVVGQGLKDEMRSAIGFQCWEMVDGD